MVIMRVGPHRLDNYKYLSEYNQQRRVCKGFPHIHIIHFFFERNKNNLYLCVIVILTIIGVILHVCVIFGSIISFLYIRMWSKQSTGVAEVGRSHWESE